MLEGSGAGLGGVPLFSVRSAPVFCTKWYRYGTSMVQMTGCRSLPFPVPARTIPVCGVIRGRRAQNRLVWARAHGTVWFEDWYGNDTGLITRL